MAEHTHRYTVTLEKFNNTSEWNVTGSEFPQQKPFKLFLITVRAPIGDHHFAGYVYDQATHWKNITKATVVICWLYLLHLFHILEQSFFLLIYCNQPHLHGLFGHFWHLWKPHDVPIEPQHCSCLVRPGRGFPHWEAMQICIEKEGADEREMFICPVGLDRKCLFYCVGLLDLLIWQTPETASVQTIKPSNHTGSNIIAKKNENRISTHGCSKHSSKCIIKSRKMRLSWV